MRQLTQHFSQAELACRCCQRTTRMHPALLVVLEDIRRQFQQPVTVTSAFRCPKHNKAVGGVPSSQHVMGSAADLQVANTDPRQVQQYLHDAPYANLLGIGSYPDFTHVDVRGYPARWSSAS